MPGREFDAKHGAISIERCPLENPGGAVRRLVSGYEQAAGSGERSARAYQESFPLALIGRWAGCIEKEAPADPRVLLEQFP